MKLYIQLTLLLLLVPLLSVIGLSISNYVNSKKLITEQVLSEVETITSGKEEQVTQFIVLTNSYLDIVSSQNSIIGAIKSYDNGSLSYQDGIELKNMFLKIQKNRAEFKEIILLDSFGKVIASSSENSTSKDFSDTSYFLEGKKAKYMSDIRKSEQDPNENFFIISSPVFEDNRMLGVVMI